ncbi:FAD-dependent oxidoreductase [Bosea sp. TWI1241]|uniref:FAD-dependent oxidoreductase n=1 Tax=Bosea sp. TWI1241 TaxID=3148904 RepID=UPI0032080107
MISRRHLIATGAAALASAPALARPAVVTDATQLLPRSGPASPRIVICGGGWGGLSAAKYLRQQLPEAEVIVIERNPVFWSCPISNKWLIDVVDTNYLLHDMFAPARRHGYTLIQTEITAIERDKKLVRTAQGRIDYDYLILAGGIRNAYDVWFGDDRRAIETTRMSFPSAYIPNSEHVALKNKLKTFKGGTMVMTLPPPPHRCPPSPYERACVMAWHMKVNKIPGKIVILDPKTRIMPIGGGFRAAFEELYPDIIQHVPNAAVREVDPFNKRIKTSAGDFDFDDAVLMPPHQAADMVWYADLIAKNPEGKPTGWADIHPTMLHARSDDSVYVIGDAMGMISPQFGHYPKSGHVANYVGKIVATYLAQRVRKQEVKVLLPDNLCYMLVNGDPREAISVQFDYELMADGTVRQTQIDVDIRTPDLLEEDFKWAQRMYGDFLA